MAEHQYLDSTKRMLQEAFIAECRTRFNVTPEREAWKDQTGEITEVRLSWRGFEALLTEALKSADNRNDYDTCREDWRYIIRRLDALAEDQATGSRDFGRGYALAIKDVKKEMTRLERLTPPRTWTLSDEVAMGLHEEPHP